MFPTVYIKDIAVLADHRAIGVPRLLGYLLLIFKIVC